MSEEAARQFVNSVKAMGFNSIAMYNMGGMDEDYIAYGTNSVKIREQMDLYWMYPFFPACPSDGTIRRVSLQGASLMWCTTTIHPKASQACSPKRKNMLITTLQPRLITINAWNEWVEGSYLLPDMLNGFSYLEAVRDAIIYDKITGIKPIKIRLTLEKFAENESYAPDS